MEKIYIGIDDTDNLDSRGTGFHARQMMERLHQNQLGNCTGITRHQLLFDDRVPYTSHNSSACLAFENKADLQVLITVCRKFLLEIAAEGSDVGLCIAKEGQASQLEVFGKSAQTCLLTQQEAEAVAEQHSIFLQGLTGDHQGIIGALSAVGLHAWGNDGRYIWAPGLREHDNQSLTLDSVTKRASIDKISLLDGTEVLDTKAVIDLGPWPRAVRINKQAVLLVEKSNDNQYQVLDKDIIKSAYP
jgi:hypothetical protein|tara:strand:+ start:816 stop:1550 length:735 start_codon:yes stop_codon:yes gene_type:complete